MRRFHEFDGVHFIPEDVVAIHPFTQRHGMLSGALAVMAGGAVVAFPHATVDMLAAEVETAIADRAIARGPVGEVRNRPLAGYNPFAPIED